MATQAKTTNSREGIKEVPVEYLKECFEYRDGVLIWKNRPLEHFLSAASCKQWHSAWAGGEAGTVGRYGYIFIKLTWNKKKYFLKRSHIVLAMHGTVVQDGEMVDHINGISADDRVENLRIVTQAQNQINRKMSTNNKSGHKGIFRRYGKWQANIGYQGKKIVLGSYETKEEAIEVRLKAERELFGEFNRSPEYL